MSELTPQELTAGVSRRALATYQRRNSSNGHGSPLAKSETLNDHLAARAIGEPEKVPVIDLWDRNLDIINLSGWHFAIRETQHTNNAVHVVEMFLRRPELEILAQRISQVLSEKPTTAAPGAE